VNLDSAASYSGASAGAAYVASKHAIAGLTKSTAWQYSKQNIRCNTVAPGGVPTNVMKDLPAELAESDGYKRASPYMDCMPRLSLGQTSRSMAVGSA